MLLLSDVGCKVLLELTNLNEIFSVLFKTVIIRSEAIFTVKRVKCIIMIMLEALLLNFSLIISLFC